jgi:hypothetical protein
MRRSKVRLVLAAVMFLAWIGYLAYLAATTARPVVLSRPQFLEADLYVIAELKNGANPDAPAAEVSVREVVWSAKGAQANGSLVVKNLPLCGRKFGWDGPGEYILALKRDEDPRGSYLVAPVPRSPGYVGVEPDPQTGLTPGPIYPATPETRRQLEILTETFHRR